MLEGGKHTFQANTAMERDNWVSVLKAKIAEAKEMAESVTNHDTYRKTHDTLSKPVLGGAAAVAPKKSEEKKLEKIEKQTDKQEDKAIATANKKEEKLEKDIAKIDKKEDKIIDTANKKEAKEEKKEEKAVAKADKEEDKAIATANKKEEKLEKDVAKIDKKEDKIIDIANKKEAKEEKKEVKTEDKTRKSRSQSRKRASIFGAIAGLGKKEEKPEERKGEPIIETPGTSTATATNEAVVAPVVATEGTHAERPAPAQKRSSIFGTLKSQFAPRREHKAETEAAPPVVPAKDIVAEPVSETAPVIPAVETTEPLATSVASPATVPTETTGDVPATNGESKAAEAPFLKADRRKSSLPWLSKKEKSAASDEEGEEKPLSPFAKLRATVKGRSSPKAAEKKEEKAEERKEEKAAASSAVPAETKHEEIPAMVSEAAPVTSDPAVSEPVSTTPVTAPQVSATA